MAKNLLSEDKMKEVIEYLPNASQVFPVQDDHFLFFFEPNSPSSEDGCD